MINDYPEPDEKYEYIHYNVWVRHMGSTNLHNDLPNVTYADAYAHWQKRRKYAGDCYILAVHIDPMEHHKATVAHHRALQRAKI